MVYVSNNQSYNNNNDYYYYCYCYGYDSYYLEVAPVIYKLVDFVDLKICVCIGNLISAITYRAKQCSVQLRAAFLTN